jgi:hypothetical protein
MKIYVTHSKGFDYKTELYVPIRKSSLNKIHEFIFPHEESDISFNSRPLILGGSLSLLIAEVSIKSTSQGVELGWANASNIPIVLFYKPNSNPSDTLKKLSKISICYSCNNELINGIQKAINELGN